MGDTLYVVVHATLIAIASLVLKRGFQGAWASLVAVHGLQSAGLVVGRLVTLQHEESSWTRGRTPGPFFGRWILYHWTIREFPGSDLFDPRVNFGRKEQFSLRWILVPQQRAPGSHIIEGDKETQKERTHFSSMAKFGVYRLFSSVQSLSHVRLFAIHELQHARPPCPSPTPRVHSNSSPSSRWCHSAISSSVVPFSPSPAAPNPSQHQSLFQWVYSSHEVAKVLEFQL